MNALAQASVGGRGDTDVEAGVGQLAEGERASLEDADAAGGPAASGEGAAKELAGGEIREGGTGETKQNGPQVRLDGSVDLVEVGRDVGPDGGRTGQ